MRLKANARAAQCSTTTANSLSPDKSPWLKFIIECNWWLINSPQLAQQSSCSRVPILSAGELSMSQMPLGRCCSYQTNVCPDVWCCQMLMKSHSGLKVRERCRIKVSQCSTIRGLINNRHSGRSDFLMPNKSRNQSSLIDQNRKTGLVTENLMTPSSVVLKDDRLSKWVSLMGARNDGTITWTWADEVCAVKVR